MATEKTYPSEFDSPRCTLRLLSYNIQVGIPSKRYRDYLTHGWKHLLPHRERHDNLSRIAKMIKDFDVVGLQELDSGSLRSGFVNHAQFLADMAQFPHWYDKTNRNWGSVARHSMGVLSRYASNGVSRHDLPGRVPGRGALMVRFGRISDPLVVVLVHLSLGKKARKQQIRFMSDLVNRYNHVILMGDFNCDADSEEFRNLIAGTGLSLPYAGLLTYPSWKPTKHIDHILVSKSIQIHDMQVLDYPLSDHLPLSMEVSLPREIFMSEQSQYKAA